MYLQIPSRRRVYFFFGLLRKNQYWVTKSIQHSVFNKRLFSRFVNKSYPSLDIRRLLLFLSGLATTATTTAAWPTRAPPTREQKWCSCSPTMAGWRGGRQLVGSRGSSGLLLTRLRETTLLVDHLVEVLQGVIQALSRDGASWLQGQGRKCELRTETRARFFT